MTKAEPTIVIGARTALIREGTEGDAAGVLRLLTLAAAETDHLSREPEEVRMTLDEEAAFLRQRVESAADLFLVAEVEDQIVGSASLDGTTLQRFRHATTLGIAVLRDFWGIGIGRALMHGLLSWADSRKIVRISLEVVETNVRAIRLYESLGFEKEGRLRAHRRHGLVYVDSFVMSRIRT